MPLAASRADLDVALRDLDVVSAYWPLVPGAELQALGDVLAPLTDEAPDRRAVAVGRLLRTVCADDGEGLSFTERLLARIPTCRLHPYLVRAATVGPDRVTPCLRQQMVADLRRWQRIAAAVDAQLGIPLPGPDNGSGPRPAVQDPMALPPPSWSAETARQSWLKTVCGARDWSAGVDALGELVHRHGLGAEQGCVAYRFEAGAAGSRLVPLQDVALFDLDWFEGNAESIAVIEANTLNLLDGFRAHNTLIWGPRGCGKSSLIRGLLARHAERGLRGIDIRPGTYAELWRLFGLVRRRRECFVGILDNIALDRLDASTRCLSTALEGGLEEMPTNLVFYATSNFKDLVDRGGEGHQGPPPMQSDAAPAALRHPHDTESLLRRGFDPQGFQRLDERRALDDRFALKVFIDMPTRSEYDRLVLAYARRVGLEDDPRDLLADFQRWRMQHGHDLVGGRTARDYILTRYPAFARGQGLIE